MHGSVTEFDTDRGTIVTLDLNLGIAFRWKGVDE